MLLVSPASVVVFARRPPLLRRRRSPAVSTLTTPTINCITKHSQFTSRYYTVRHLCASASSKNELEPVLDSDNHNKCSAYLTAALFVMNSSSTGFKFEDILKAIKAFFEFLKILFAAQEAYWKWKKAEEEGKTLQKKRKEDEAAVISTDDKTSTGKRSNPSKAASVVKKPSKATVSRDCSPALVKASKSLVPIGKSYKATGKRSKDVVASEKPAKIVSADEIQAVKEKFVERTAIEVKSDEDGFQGAWFAADILEVLSKDKFLIEYKNLKKDADKKLCREEVDILHIRPVPPNIVKVDGYSLHEEVDALYKDGWLVGVISGVYSEFKYMVFFRDTNKELEFNHSDLRVHQEWIDGKWYVPSKALGL